MAEKSPITAVVAASLADVKQGSYVGIATLPQADGSQKALEVLIFPEAMRGFSASTEAAAQVCPILRG